jgi:hypothetical protein
LLFRTVYQHIAFVIGDGIRISDSVVSLMDCQTLTPLDVQLSTTTLTKLGMVPIVEEKNSVRRRSSNLFYTFETYNWASDMTLDSFPRMTSGVTSREICT